MTLSDLYLQWCKETKRGGAILIGGSIREFFTWVEKQGYTLLKLEKGEQVR